MHYAYGPQGKIRIIRKSGQRYCQDCIQHTDESTEKNKKKVHAWAAVSHEFKSDIILYNVPGNTNGKMSQRVYIDQILKFVVKSWLDRGDDFCLKENEDSGHGISKHNIVRTWKEEHGLKNYFNSASFSDLSSIENCWQSSKQYIRKFLHWDEATTVDLVYEGWATVSQRFINEKVDEMPQRLQAVIDGDGAMTGY